MIDFFHFLIGWGVDCKQCPSYDIKQHLVVRLQFRGSRECEVYCYYSQVHHSDPEWLYLLVSYLRVK